ncbi:hypothetical protein A2U01_0068302, partial [Trifolium medium]|nr:hypothetical protein [Trifolium medium]
VPNKGEDVIPEGDATDDLLSPAKKKESNEEFHREFSTSRREHP